MLDISAANLLSWMAQALVVASVGSILPVVFRIRHPRTQLLYSHALLLACLLLPIGEAWHPATPIGAPAAKGQPPESAALSESAANGVVTRPPSLAPPVPLPRPATSFLATTFLARRVLPWILAAGFLGRLLWLLAGLWRIRTYRIAATPLYPLPESIQAAAALTGTDALFCVSSDAPGPVTMGLLCPVVLLPESIAELGDEAQCGVACHELLHVRRGDWLIALLEELAGALLWFNPAVWWLLAEMRLAREELVDAEAVRLTAAREPYIDALLAIARGRRILDLAPAPLFLRRRHLTHRMHLLLKEVSMSKLRLLCSYGSMTAIVAFAGWFALASFPLTARPQVKPAPASLAMAAAPVALAVAAPEVPATPAPDAVESAPAAAAATTPCEPQAYVPDLRPLFQPQAALPESAFSQFGEERVGYESVTMLVTVGPQGSVTGAEALSGIEILRQPAVDAVLHFKYRPVMRNGQPVCALTVATTVFQTPGKPLTPPDSANQFAAAMKRQRELESQWPRSPQQVLADMQQDLDVAGGSRRQFALPALAKTALAAGALDQAVVYAKDMLDRDSGGGGDAIFYGNMVLGQVALRNGDVAAAKQYLIASGKTPGSPVLDSFGPNMSLAKELLDRGERDAVLEFFSLCRVFWANHAQILDSWSETVRREHLPDFGANLRY